MLTLAVGLCKYRFVKICHSLTFCVKISKLENKNFFQGKELSVKTIQVCHKIDLTVCSLHRDHSQA